MSANSVKYGSTLDYNIRPGLDSIDLVSFQSRIAVLTNFASSGFRDVLVVPESSAWRISIVRSGRSLKYILVT